LRRILLVFASGCLLLSAVQADAQILHKKKRANKSTSASNTAEPDKILYDKAMDDIKHGRQEVGRLALQTLINTYPDSEYLAKAKLAIADSFYKEGGSANLTQAVQSYKDFIVFFPFLQEAAYAQHQVAMTHYKQMDKPDRDRTQARAAEEEFQTFLQKYPNDPLAPAAEQHLREVQQVLAEGDYRIGYFYYVKGDKRAAAGRLLTVTERYPLYSHSDKALWMLGDIFDKSERKDMASRFYARIVRDYPLSALVPDAKSRLTAIKAPIPQADPKAVAWMTAEQNAPRPGTSLIKKPIKLLAGGPTGEVRAAAHSGLPTMTPESETPGTEILSAGGQAKTGPSIIATVQSGGTAATGTAENTGTSDASGTANPVPASGNAGETSPPASEGTAPASTSGAAAKPGETAAGDPSAPAPSAAAAGGDPVANPDTKPADGQSQDAAANSDQKPGQTDQDPKKESTSKKKKGLRKIVPW
jgi:outer membrane protein assembly factor BamD